LTHTGSGYALISNVPIRELTLLAALLRPFDWERSIDEIYNDATMLPVLLEFIAQMNKRNLGYMEEERTVAAMLGGTVQPASGSKPGRRRDVTSPVFLVEVKTTEAPAYTLDLEDIAKLRELALMQQKVGMYAICFLNKAKTIRAFLLHENDIEGVDTPPQGAIASKAGQKTITVSRQYCLEVVRDDVWYKFLLPDGAYYLVNLDYALRLAR
jgi:hypothetical protein